MSRSLRVVHLAGGSGPDASNGVGRAVYHLATAQRALGHDVSIVSERAEHVDVQQRIEPSPLLAVRTRLARRTRHAAPTLVRELLDQRPDIIHLHSIHVLENVSISRYLRTAGVPYCVTIHGGLSGNAQQRGRVKKAALWWLGEGRYLDNALFIHALTCDEAKDIAAYGVKAPTVVAPNGIDAAALPRPVDPTALFTRAPQLAGHRVFMFMGRVAPVQKGLDVLIQGFAEANHPNARLVILGPDWRGSRVSLECQVERLGLGTRVVFLDGETPQRCADLIAGADVFVHTSRWEGMSLAVLEAAVWEKPSLLTRAADPNGAMEQADAAVIVDLTPESIADGLRRMAALDDDALLAMGRRARCTATTQFTWNRAATALIAAYGQGRGMDR
jgi:glycosyltransferase involved in cell wall biosynthesis